MDNSNTSRSRSRFLWFSGAVLGAFLMVFLVAEAAGFDFSGVLGKMEAMRLPLAALAGVGMLLADIFLPTPSSLVMIANGALFGFVLGAALSLAGALGATLLGYGVGKWGSGKVEKWIGRAAMEQGHRLLERYGLFAVMVTRPVPLLAETVAVVAGTSGLSLRKVLLGSLAGLLPTCAIYAWAGANLQSDTLGVWPFLLVFGLASLLFLIGYFRQKRSKSEKNT